MALGLNYMRYPVQGMRAPRTPGELLLEQAIVLNDTAPTFTRASTAYDPYVNAAAISGARRRRPLPISRTLTVFADLIEGSRTNFIKQSQTFDNASWAKANATITADQIAAPDGTLTADMLAATTTAATTVNIDALASAVTGAMTYSVWLKQGNMATCGLVLRNNTTAANVVTSTVTFATKAISASGTGTPTATLVEDRGNGWLRYALTSTSFTAGDNVRCYCVFPGNSQTIGDFTYAWGAQLEAAAFPSSYIPTTSATVTRASDSLTASLTSLTDPRTNLLTFSEQFDNAAWLKTRATITANATNDPNGNAYADKLVEDGTAATTHNLSQGIVKAASSLAYTFSVYLKAAEFSWVRISVADTGLTNQAWQYFDVGTGALGTAGTDGAGFTRTASSITSVGGGWYRCVFSATSDASTVLKSLLYMATGDNGFSFSGTSTRGIYVWGAQLEQAAAAGPYLPVATTAVSAAQTGLSTTDGTLLALCIPYGWTTDQDAGVHNWRPLQDAGAAAALFGRASATTMTMRRYDVAGAELTTVTPGLANNTLTHLAMTYNANAITGYLNGVANGAPDTSLTAPYVTCTSLLLGGAGGTEFYGWVAVLYWPRVLSAADLLSIYQALPAAA